MFREKLYDILRKTQHREKEMEEDFAEVKCIDCHKTKRNSQCEHFESTSTHELAKSTKTNTDYEDGEAKRQKRTAKFQITEQKNTPVCSSCHKISRTKECPNHKLTDLSEKLNRN